MNACALSFNGERLDPLSRTLHLGNGYRAYSPVLMRFNCPDSLSPFGAGGINAYAYCEADPINRSDPSGHSWQGIMGMVTGALGLALIPFTLGESITVTIAITAGLQAISGITAIASGAMEYSHPGISTALGWASFATGLASVGTAVSSAINRFGNRLLASEALDTVSTMSSASDASSVLAQSDINEARQTGRILYGFNPDHEVYPLGFAPRGISRRFSWAYSRPISGGNELVVIGHGTPGRFVLGSGYYQGAYKDNLTAGEFWNMLKSRIPDIDSFKKITLASCHSAEGSDSLMSGVLVNVKRGVTVTGYKRTVLWCTFWNKTDAAGNDINFWDWADSLDMLGDGSLAGTGRIVENSRQTLSPLEIDSFIFDLDAVPKNLERAVTITAL